MSRSELVRKYTKQIQDYSGALVKHRETLKIAEYQKDWHDGKERLERAKHNVKHLETCLRNAQQNLDELNNAAQVDLGLFGGAT